MHWKSVLLSLLVAAVALSGCADKSTTQADPTDPCEVCGQVTKDTGVIRGVIVDSAIRPITGVTVTVLMVEGEEQQMETATDGLFGFGKLAPGDYFVTVEKPGYYKVQQSVAVIAGVAEPPATRILLESDPETRPYYSTHSFTGFIECSFRARDGTGTTSAVFGEPYYFGHNTCSSLDNQETNFVVEFDQAPQWVQGELTWQSSQATGSGLSLVLGPDSCIDTKWGRSDGTSPLITAMNETVVRQNTDDAADAGACFRVFAWSAPEFGDSIGAALAQEFNLIVHSFYNMAPEPGWTFGGRGEPVTSG